MQQAKAAVSEADAIFAQARVAGVPEVQAIALLKRGHLVLDEHNKGSKEYSMREAVSDLEKRFPDRNATVVIIAESGGCLFRAVDVQAVTEQVSTGTQGNSEYYRASVDGVLDIEHYDRVVFTAGPGNAPSALPNRCSHVCNKSRGHIGLCAGQSSASVSAEVLESFASSKNTKTRKRAGAKQSKK
jgi:hypothetical protein